ncbi:arylsulfatase D-like [Erinaceus europaeus]|uniref:Arylsulfatase D-like n=1 Tax=Erinaceus europaeus TaxID=9365 RepID=A0ABM3WQ35_ERIEU|nr:arylsulfatase D-like [Erinaceus europaeus]
MAAAVLGSRAWWLLLLLLLMAAGRPLAASNPNFLIIMADDLGIGDLGCYGNSTLSTPNIDRLAREGVRLTQHLAAAPLCTPSRAAFLTGRHAFRSGMDAVGGGYRALQWNAGSGGLPPNETTFAQVLKERGYATGIIGKWHLGVSCETRDDHCHHPLRHGFESFYGLPFTLLGDCDPAGPPELDRGLRARGLGAVWVLGLAAAALALLGVRGRPPLGWELPAVLGGLLLGAWVCTFGLVRRWNCVVMRDHGVAGQPLDLPTLTPALGAEARSFLHRHRSRPFLLFLALPHVHLPLVTAGPFLGSSQHGRYGDSVQEMDGLVGDVLNALDANGLTNTTFTYFTSDHGGFLEARDEHGRLGGWNGIYRGGKGMGGWEGGIRVPGIVRWPGQLEAGLVIHEPTSLMDVFPTLVELGGGRVPQDRVMDGHSLLPLLKGEVQHSAHEFMFHYCGDLLHAARWHERESGLVWKMHLMTPRFQPEGSDGCHDSGLCPCSGPGVAVHSPPLLFELTSDPSEARALGPGSEPRFQAVLARLARAVEAHRATVTPAPAQFSLINILWRPWLQPCCGTFPFCGCSQDGQTDGAPEPRP